VRFRVTVDSTAGGTTLANEATLAYEANASGAPFTHVTKRTQTPVAPSADLSVTKRTEPDPAVAGADITSMIVVTNNGPNPAIGVTVTDELSAGVSPISANPATCLMAAQTVTCPLGDLAAGQP
jgi:uncharacterized repeat protein (TIGR01451 family)